ncbi:MAG: CRISPR-associated protein [Bacteroidales bacterium]|nr:CRISPR-associated protein [Bacteroidales bacterium]MCF8389028.1 CRISPR-associated protein [Bacteroidales bacterium]MCF8398519.1 CRISPR-associated protein [Bacteroidales bacterium]
MLLNLSNHPYQYWPEIQLQAAKLAYGKIVDMNFPPINPHADKNEISLLAEQYAKKCLALLKDEKIKAVHIMGEMTFCFKVVSLLQQQNITCLASTSNRSATFITNNEKHAKFDFVRFREYPRL